LAARPRACARCPSSNHHFAARIVCVGGQRPRKDATAAASLNPKDTTMAKSDQADCKKADAFEKSPARDKDGRKDGIRKRVLARLGGCRTIVEIGALAGAVLQRLAQHDEAQSCIWWTVIATSEDEQKTAKHRQNAARWSNILMPVKKRFPTDQGRTSSEILPRLTRQRAEDVAECFGYLHLYSTATHPMSRQNRPSTAWQRSASAYHAG